MILKIKEIFYDLDLYGCEVTEDCDKHTIFGEGDFYTIAETSNKGFITIQHLHKEQLERYMKTNFGQYSYQTSLYWKNVGIVEDYRFLKVKYRDVII